ncbi:MAG: phosphoenolpyruvate--protein phosphotransferase [Planctomycetota bacterium]|jgi:phosphotransferase system enzyme I (PtsI)
MKRFQGIPVSPGIVIGRVFILDHARRRIPRRSLDLFSLESEVERFNKAIDASITDLTAQRDKTRQELSPETAQIFAFHIGMLSDATLLDPIRSRIVEEHVAAEYAVSEQFQLLADRFASMKDTAFATKVDDVWDIERRVLTHLLGEQRTRLEHLGNDAIVVAKELTPSEAAQIERDRVIGFATDTGGLTSHTAIVARALGIPAVVGLKHFADAAEEGATVIIDGSEGLAILDPDEQALSEYRHLLEQQRSVRLSLSELTDLPSITADGVRINIMGNIEFPTEINAVLENGGDGVGLYRTEFLYLTSTTEPSEEDHFQAYKSSVELLAGKPLTIRTLDVGADKPNPHQRFAAERNPALGARSIRYSLQHIPEFKRQLRAILRASVYGPISVMFPLITNPLEHRQASMIIGDVKEDLQEEGIEYDPQIKVGMMVETPAAAIMASTFAREVDFFSIGTNDLVQYTLAVDRTNERVAGLYSAAHPAVIKLMKEVVRAARRRNVSVSVCGEAAGQVEFTMLLIGLGLRTLSVSPALIPSVKRLVRSVDIDTCERLARRVGSFDSERQVTAFLREKAQTSIPEVFDGRSVE